MIGSNTSGLERYIVGEYALDVATVARVTVQSTVYPIHQSPLMQPGELRWNPDNVILDLSRLDWWDRFRVMWSRVGMHYLIDKEG